jgi:hypothetical protein
VITSGLTDRQRISVAGADDVLAAYLGRVDGGAPAGVAAAQALDASDVDWPGIRPQVVAAGRSVVLAEHPGGPVLAARFFDPDSPTTIHDHGSAGAGLVVEGRDRYERFERSSDGTARLESIHDLAAGDVIWWNEPPDDVHRQTSIGDGSIELILLARPPGVVTELADVGQPASELRAALVAGFLDGDAARLAAWYGDDVLLDANVPKWRFQVRGRDGVLEGLASEELVKPDRRLTFLRATDTASGVLLETEMRFSEGGTLRQCREAHHLRVRENRVVEHVIWCTGIADADTARRQLIDAPMVRL